MSLLCSGRAKRRGWGSGALGVVLGAGAVAALAWIALWLQGAVTWRASFALLTFTPLVAVGALLLLLVAAATRRWVTAGALALAVVGLAVLVVPRAVPGGEPPPAAPGVPALRVATVNLQFGRADAGAVVALARERRITVLSLQELTPDAERRLAAAGLFTEMPFRVTAARDGAGGTGLVARVPLARVDVGLRPAVFEQVAARIDTPSTGRVEVLAVHPAAPFTRDTASRWAAEVRALPPPRADGTRRVVLGDYNATLDHRPLRDLLATGYRDAAAEAGTGLRGTWPTDQSFPPFAAIDHVLLAGPLGTRDVVVTELPGSDHAAVVATLAAERPPDQP